MPRRQTTSPKCPPGAQQPRRHTPDSVVEEIDARLFDALDELRGPRLNRHELCRKIVGVLNTTRTLKGGKPLTEEERRALFPEGEL